MEPTVLGDRVIERKSPHCLRVLEMPPRDAGRVGKNGWVEQTLIPGLFWTEDTHGHRILGRSWGACFHSFTPRNLGTK